MLYKQNELKRAGMFATWCYQPRQLMHGYSTPCADPRLPDGESMSHMGTSTDKPSMASFFKTLNVEWMRQTRFDKAYVAD